MRAGRLRIISKVVGKRLRLGLHNLVVLISMSCISLRLIDRLRVHNVRILEQVVVLLLVSCWHITDTLVGSLQAALNDVHKMLIASLQPEL